MSDPLPRTLEELRAEYPWPQELLASGQAPLEVLWTFEVAATPEALWPLVADTSRVNRAIGVARMQFEEEKGILRGRSRVLGMPQEWDELPWTWVAARRLANVRRYRRGLAHWVRSLYRLEPLSGQRTRFYVYFGWVPRGRWQRALLKAGMGRVGEGFARVMPDLERAAQARLGPAVPGELPFARAAPPLPPEAAARLESMRETLYQRGVERACADRLVEHVRAGDDLELYRLQVRPLARRWSVSEESLLAGFLHATRAGLLNLSWDVICPHCRGVRDQVASLGDVPRTARCDVCAIEFGTEDETGIEIAFQVHPSIRDVPQLFFCSAEPATKAHIQVQEVVAPGSVSRAATRLAEGGYRLRIAGEERYGTLEIGGGAPEAEIRWGAAEPPVRARSGPSPSLVLENPGPAPVTFVVEQGHWSDDALRPASLFSFQEFRDLFSEEYLRSDIQLSVGQQTILFTDLVGSTRMYAARGDPGAFADVKKHFTEIYEEVKKRHGVVVKTIGDATMAAFRDPVGALEASWAIQQRFHAGRQDLPLRVRITLNTGPCIAVKLDTNIDYFGGTVNIAAKLQGWAEAGQVTFSRNVREQPGVEALLTRFGARPEELSIELAALDAPITAYRWDVDTAPAAHSPETRGR